MIDFCLRRFYNISVGNYKSYVPADFSGCGLRGKPLASLSGPATVMEELLQITPLIFWEGRRRDDS